MSDDYIDRDYDQESLAFIDPAISIFDSSTPKYKMRVQESPNTSDSKRMNDSMRSSKWETQNSISRQDNVQKIIDYKSSDHVIGEDQRDSVNMQTPTRVKGTTTLSPPEQSKGTQEVKRTLDFSRSSIEIDTVVPSRTMDADVVATTPEMKSTLAGPKPDVSPETEVLKHSTLQGELKSKIPSSVGKGNECPGSNSRPIISPTQTKMDSDFAQHLVDTMRNSGTREEDISFVDALSRTAATVTTITAPASQVIPSQDNDKSEISTLSNAQQEQEEQCEESHDSQMTTPVAHNKTRTPLETMTTAASPALPVHQPPSSRKTPASKVMTEGGGGGMDGGVYDEWKVTETPQGKKYYYNRRTRMSAWA